jgi:hypothetical protein
MDGKHFFFSMSVAGMFLIHSITTVFGRPLVIAKHELVLSDDFIEVIAFSIFRDDRRL